MLTSEKIEEIKNQLQGLEGEEQQQKLKEILEDLSPEEREQLMGGRECPFCSMAEGKIPVKTVYEDDLVLAILDINPANKGHVLVFPKEHAGVLAQVPDHLVKKLFDISNKIATAVFEATNAHGTNILVANGTAAGQTSPHVLVNVIPRFEGDKVSIGWEAQKVEENELEDLVGKIQSKIPKTAPKPIAQPIQEFEEDKLDSRIP